MKNGHTGGIRAISPPCGSGSRRDAASAAPIRYDAAGQTGACRASGEDGDGTTEGSLKPSARGGQKRNVPHATRGGNNPVWGGNHGKNTSPRPMITSPHAVNSSPHGNNTSPRAVISSRRRVGDVRHCARGGSGGADGAMRGSALRKARTAHWVCPRRGYRSKHKVALPPERKTIPANENGARSIRF